VVRALSGHTRWVDPFPLPPDPPSMPSAPARIVRGFSSAAGGWRRHAADELRWQSRAPAGRAMRAAATTTDRRGAGLYRPRLGRATLTVARTFLLVRRTIKKSRTCPRPDLIRAEGSWARPLAQEPPATLLDELLTEKTFAQLRLPSSQVFSCRPAGSLRDGRNKTGCLDVS
jgi:hypothetical protein